MERTIAGSPSIEIGDNILKYGDSVIQLSNISSIEVAPIPKEPYPTWSTLGIIISILLFVSELSAIKMLGLVFLAVCIANVYRIYNKNSHLGKYLIFEMNSGRSILFSSDEEIFLAEAKNKITECFDSNMKCKINLKECVISNCDIAGGNMEKGNIYANNAKGSNIVAGNTGNTTIKNHVSLEEENDWDTLKNFLIEYSANSDKSDKYETLLLQTFLAYCDKKDKRGLKTFIDSNIEKLSSGILSNVLSAGIISAIRNLTGIQF